MSDARHLTTWLESYCRQRLPGHRHARLVELTRLATGWESDVYHFSLTDVDEPLRSVDVAPNRPGAEALVLRVYPGDFASEKSRREFDGISLLARVGYPVPAVYHHEDDISVIGQPFVVMEYVAGRDLSAERRAATPDDSDRLLSGFCQLLVNLHALHPSVLAELAPSVISSSFVGRSLLPISAGRESSIYMSRYLDWAEATLDQHGLAGFRPAVTWLRERAADVAPSRLAIVHLDFHPRNVLVRSDGRLVVIDWTQIDVADYRLDLAWTLILLASYDGQIARDAVLRRYEDLTGGPTRQLEYFEVIACLKRLFSLVVSLTAGPEKLGMRPGAQSLMTDSGSGRHMADVYALYRERTGVTIPEVEALLTKHG